MKTKQTEIIKKFLVIYQKWKVINEEKINPQILKEWTAAGLPKNKYFVGDVNSEVGCAE